VQRAEPAIRTPYQILESAVRNAAFDHNVRFDEAIRAGDLTRASYHRERERRLLRALREAQGG
jgi:hypothetical protein